ncbi:uncharacterized protein [Antedon mediterranea]|uniref:uncharacterized protein n=1 Tax=Antedon mediterranea TaxID=105859 RepID=UPI003AF8E312
MAKRLHTHNPYNRNIPLNHKHDGVDTTDGRTATPQKIISASSKLKRQNDSSVVGRNSVHEEEIKSSSTFHEEETNSRPGSSFSVYRPLPDIGQKWSKTTSSDLLDNVINDVSSLHIQENHSPHVKKKKRMKDSTAPYEDIKIKNVVQNYSIKPHSPDVKGHVTSATIKHGKGEAEGMFESHSRKISRRELRSMQLRQRRNSQMRSVQPEPTEEMDRLLIAIRLPTGERFQRFFLPSSTVTDVITFAEYQVKESFADCDVFMNCVPKKKLQWLKESLGDCGVKDRTLLLLEEKDEDEITDNL